MMYAIVYLYDTVHALIYLYYTYFIANICILCVNDINILDSDRSIAAVRSPRWLIRLLRLFSFLFTAVATVRYSVLVILYI